MKKKIIIYLLISLLLLQSALALKSKIDFSDAFETLGKAFKGILDNDYATFAVTMILLYILFYALFERALSKVRIFEGSGGVGASNPAKVLAVTLSLLTVIAIGYWYFSKGGSVHKFLLTALGPYRIYAGVITAILMFLMIKDSFDDKKNAWIAAGIITAVLGYLLQIPIMLAGGIIVTIIAIIAKNGGWGGGYGHYQEQRIERGLQREVAQERQEEQRERQTEQQLQREEQIDNRLLGELRDQIALQRQIINHLENEVRMLAEQQGRLR